MPYIKQENRPKFDLLVLEAASEITCDGDLNYFITALAHELILRRGLCYQTLNNIDGALKQVSDELNRAVVAPYEILKRKENGFVSKLDQMLAEGKVPDPIKY